MPVEDDETIGPDDTAYRRIARSDDTGMLIFDEGTNEYRVRSGAFSMVADGCSVYLGSIMVSAGLTAADLARAPQNVIVSVTVDQVRGVGLGIRRDAWPPDSDGTPRDAAHALIVNSSNLSNRACARALKSLARMAEIRYWGPNHHY